MKTKGLRQSANVEDVRSPKAKKVQATKTMMGTAMDRQMFDPKASKNLTKVTNVITSGLAGAPEGLRMKRMLKPAGKVTAKFKRGIK